MTLITEYDAATPEKQAEMIRGTLVLIAAGGDSPDSFAAFYE